MSDTLVTELLAAREHHRALAPPSARQALTPDEAYAVQDRLREALVARGERVVGWKAGFTNKAAQAALLAVAGAVPALELVDFRYGGKPVGTDLIADGVYASAIVLGAPMTDVSQLDLAVEGLVYELNGTVAATNAAAEVMGNPLNSLAWIANHLGARGLGLEAGDLVMSGSVSQLLRPKAGDTVRATFTRLGSADVRVV